MILGALLSVQPSLPVSACANRSHSDPLELLCFSTADAHPKSSDAPLRQRLLATQFICREPVRCAFKGRCQYELKMDGVRVEEDMEEPSRWTAVVASTLERLSFAQRESLSSMK